MAPVYARTRVPIAVAAALLASAAAAAPAAAFTPAGARAVADRSAIAWARTQQHANGAFTDYVSKRPSEGYASVMIGYGLMRAGVRRHDRALLRTGFRAVGAALRKDPGRRGVFD